MVALSVVSLCVFIFSAYAYGATTLLALRQVPVWGGGGAAAGGRAHRATLEPVVLVLCSVSTIWFVLHALAEFRLLLGAPDSDAIEIASFILTYSFPPLIMHTVLAETAPECFAGHRERWAVPVWVMYALSAIVGGGMLAAALDVLRRPSAWGLWQGVSIGLLFSICSIYGVALMTRRNPAVRVNESSNEQGLRRTMIGLFLTMIPLFFALLFLHDRAMIGEALNRVARTLPIFFLITSIYYENRFEFYDLIVKRAAMLMTGVVLLGVFFVIALGTLDRLPGGLARPWLYGVAMLPMALVLPWVNAHLGRWLDRMWFGREFTPVEAVKRVLSAMHAATDDATLVEAAEQRLSEMFAIPVYILLGDTIAPAGSVVETVVTPGATDVRVAVRRRPESRPLLSEDVSLLRSLVGVFAYMLENIRLQRQRREQDQLEQELRLQTSRSELKALRAQINPHFLFNALNAIASLIHTDPARADRAVEQLAEVFRYTLRRSEQDWAPLDQELAFAHAYLDVEQARFGRRLSFSIDAAPATAGAEVPSMVLQTLVENAVKHGISQVRGTGRVEIRATAAGETLVLDVVDSGPGPQQMNRRSSGEGFGLRSIRDRLRGHFGDRASLSLTRDEARGVTIARVEMPLAHEHAGSVPA